MLHFTGYGYCSMSRDGFHDAYKKLFFPVESELGKVKVDLHGQEGTTLNQSMDTSREVRMRKYPNNKVCEMREGIQ